MRRTKIIPIRLIQANHDTDWDGVPNYRDCQPLNPLRQDNLPEMIIKSRYSYPRRSVKDVLGDYPFNERTGHMWDTKEQAEKHAKTLRKSSHGVLKKDTYDYVKVKPVGNKWASRFKESKDYIYWLRTGIHIGD